MQPPDWLRANTGSHAGGAPPPPPPPASARAALIFVFESSSSATRRTFRASDAMTACRAAAASRQHHPCLPATHAGTSPRVRARTHTSNAPYVSGTRRSRAFSHAAAACNLARARTRSPRHSRHHPRCHCRTVPQIYSHTSASINATESSRGAASSPNPNIIDLTVLAARGGRESRAGATNNGVRTHAQSFAKESPTVERPAAARGRGIALEVAAAPVLPAPPPSPSPPPPAALPPQPPPLPRPAPGAGSNRVTAPVLPPAGKSSDRPSSSSSYAVPPLTAAAAAAPAAGTTTTGGAAAPAAGTTAPRRTAFCRVFSMDVSPKGPRAESTAPCPPALRRRFTPAPAVAAAAAPVARGSLPDDDDDAPRAAPDALGITMKPSRPAPNNQQQPADAVVQLLCLFTNVGTRDAIHERDVFCGLIFRCESERSLARCIPGVRSSAWHRRACI